MAYGGGGSRDARWSGACTSVMGNVTSSKVFRFLVKTFANAKYRILMEVESMVSTGTEVVGISKVAELLEYTLT